MQESNLEFACRLAKGLASQFGRNCEVVIHDLRSEDKNHSIVAIENGHVTGRTVGDGPSHIVLEALNNPSGESEDRYSYLTRTPDGRVLKSSTIFIHDDDGSVIGLLGINYDISMFIADNSYRYFRFFIQNTCSKKTACFCKNFYSSSISDLALF